MNIYEWLKIIYNARSRKKDHLHLHGRLSSVKNMCKFIINIRIMKTTDVEKRVQQNGFYECSSQLCLFVKQF